MLFNRVFTFEIHEELAFSELSIQADGAGTAGVETAGKTGAAGMAAGTEAGIAAGVEHAPVIIGATADVPEGMGAEDAREAAGAGTDMEGTTGAELTGAAAASLEGETASD